MSDAQLNRLARGNGKRAIVRKAREVNKFLAAYIDLSITTTAALVKVDPRNEIFSDGSLNEAFFRKALSKAGISEGRFLVLSEPNFFVRTWKRIFYSEKANSQKDV